MGIGWSSHSCSTPSKNNLASYRSGKKPCHLAWLVVNDVKTLSPRLGVAVPTWKSWTSWSVRSRILRLDRNEESGDSRANHMRYLRYLSDSNPIRLHDNRTLFSGLNFTPGKGDDCTLWQSLWQSVHTLRSSRDKYSSVSLLPFPAPLISSRHTSNQHYT